MPCPASKCSIGLWGHFRWALLLNKQPLTANPAETTEAAMPLSPAPFPRVTRLSSPRTRERRDCGLSPVWTCAVTYCFYKESLSLKIPQEPIISGDRTPPHKLCVGAQWWRVASSRSFGALWPRRKGREWEAGLQLDSRTRYEPTFCACNRGQRHERSLSGHVAESRLER